MVDSTITIGDLLTIGAFIVTGIVFYFSSFTNVVKALADHAARIKQGEKTDRRHEAAIEKLFDVKADKKR